MKGIGTMANTFFGLTTASEIAKIRNHWEKLFYETNDEIERFQQFNNALEAENLAIKAKLEAMTAKAKSLTQEISDCKVWAAHLEVTNKNLTLKIEALLTELRTSELAHNEATIQVTQAKLAAQRQRAAIRIAIDNFNLETKDI